MLLVFFGPSSSGKSTTAEILAKRTGAEIWTGKDYLRLARNEYEARNIFMRKLRAAGHGNGPESGHIIYVITDVPESVPEIMKLPLMKRIGFTADLKTLGERFAPRNGGHLPPSVNAMLERTKLKADSADADLRFDTTSISPEEAAKLIQEYLEKEHIL